MSESCTVVPHSKKIRQRQLDGRFSEEDGRRLHTRTFVVSFDVDNNQLSSCVPCAEAVYTGPPTRLISESLESPLHVFSTRTAKAYDENGERDFEEDEYEPLTLPTNSKVRVCGTPSSVNPPKEGDVTVHFVVEDTVVVRGRVESDLPNYRIVDGLPAPCSGGCGQIPLVEGCPVQ